MPYLTKLATVARRTGYQVVICVNGRRMSASSGKMN